MEHRFNKYYTVIGSTNVIWHNYYKMYTWKIKQLKNQNNICRSYLKTILLP